MNNEMVEKCDICGNTNYLIHKGTRDNPNIDVFYCPICHTKQLSKIKDNDYESGFMNGKEVLTDEDIKNRIESCKSDDLRRANMLMDKCINADLLDFGCGLGGFLNAVKDRCKSVQGVELSNSERNYLISNGFDVKKTIDEFDCLFDIVTLFHVFEHLNNPQHWLNKIADHLKIGGMCYIEVPNSEDALLELYNSNEFADFTYWSAHLYLYSVDSLSKVVEENGRFEIVSKNQIQRYSLANHLYWLANGKPGGHKIWNFLDNEKINEEYRNLLMNKNMCDTLLFEIKRIV